MIQGGGENTKKCPEGSTFLQVRQTPADICGEHLNNIHISQQITIRVVHIENNTLVALCIAQLIEITCSNLICRCVAFLTILSLFG